MEPITVEEALVIVNTVLQPERLSPVQELVLRQSWSGLTYGEIATQAGYSIQHIRDVGYRLWQLLSTVLGEKLSKSNMHFVIGQRSQKWHLIIRQQEGREAETVKINRNSERPRA